MFLVVIVRIILYEFELKTLKRNLIGYILGIKKIILLKKIISYMENISIRRILEM